MPDRNFTRRQRREVKLSYHSGTDSLHIHFSETPGAEVVQISEGVAGDENGRPVGIDIEADTSEMVDLSRLELDVVSLESLHSTEGRKVREW